MQSRGKGLAAALLLVLLFGIGGCSGREEVYLAGVESDHTVTESDTAGGETAGTEDRKDEAVQAAYVYVCGAVRNPGVYPVTRGMRMFEAIELAGGFTEEADEQWLNQAEVLHDGQRLYVYTMEETQQMAATEMPSGQETSSDPASEQKMQDGKVNLNTAGREELMTLPGIGEAKADAVIAYRTEHGAFASIEEIQNIPGIKSAVFSKIKDQITV